MEKFRQICEESESTLPALRPRPSLSVALSAAPAARSRSTMAAWPSFAALCNGARPGTRGEHGSNTRRHPKRYHRKTNLFCLKFLQERFFRLQRSKIYHPVEQKNQANYRKIKKVMQNYLSSTALLLFTVSRSTGVASHSSHRVSYAAR